MFKWDVFCKFQTITSMCGFFICSLRHVLFCTCHFTFSQIVPCIIDYSFSVKWSVFHSFLCKQSVSAILCACHGVCLVNKLSATSYCLLLHLIFDGWRGPSLGAQVKCWHGLAYTLAKPNLHWIELPHISNYLLQITSAYSTCSEVSPGNRTD